jgi:large repetitive protein
VNFLARVSLLTLLIAVAGQLCDANAQVPRFLTPVSYSVPGATMAVVADLNHDGILDIVTANGGAPGGNGVSVLLGLGHGKFKAATKIVTGSSPSWVLVGDFNNDGKADIAVANEPNPNVLISVTGGPPPNSVSILFGNGDGTFRPSIDTATAGALALGAGDFNKDGKLDLIVVSGPSTSTQILLNTGNGSFSVTNANVDGFPNAIVGDFNGDGKLDFLTGGWEMLGNGDGTFTLGQSLPVNADLAADFNGDGIPDLAQLVPTNLGRIVVGLMSLGLPDGTWAPSFISDFSGRGMVAGDFNGDGKMDIFGTGAPKGDGINPPIGGLVLGKGDGTFTFGAPGFGASAFPAVGDLDHNGSPDVVIANGSSILVALNTFGHPPLLAQLLTSATFVVGGTTTATGTVSLGGPAPAAGALVTLTSNSPAASFPNGNSVTIPANAVTSHFTIAIHAVTASTPVTISATYQSTKLTTRLTVVPPSTLTSVSTDPVSLFGMFGGNPAVGMVTLSGPAANGTVVSLTSANPAALKLPASVALAPGATTATFAISAQHVTTEASVAISGTLGTTTSSTTVTVRKETATIAVTKAEYVVSKGQLTLEATGTDRVGSLQIFNANSGVLVGQIPLVNVGKFSGKLHVTGTFTSVAAQSSVGGLSIAPVAQK